MFRHAGAYPLFPVFLLSNRVGKMSSRPRNSERNSRTLSADVRGIGASRARGNRTRISCWASSAANLARSAASRCLDSVFWASSVARRASSWAMASRNASPPAPWAGNIRKDSGSGGIEDYRRSWHLRRGAGHRARCGIRLREKPEDDLRSDGRPSSRARALSRKLLFIMRKIQWAGVII